MGHSRGCSRQHHEELSLSLRHPTSLPQGTSSKQAFAWPAGNVAEQGPASEELVPPESTAAAERARSLAQVEADAAAAMAELVAEAQQQAAAQPQETVARGSSAEQLQEATSRRGTHENAAWRGMTEQPSAQHLPPRPLEPTPSGDLRLPERNEAQRVTAGASKRDAVRCLLLAGFKNGTPGDPAQRTPAAPLCCCNRVCSSDLSAFLHGASLRQRRELPCKARLLMPADAEAEQEASAEADRATTVEIITYAGGAAEAEQGPRVTAEQAASAFHSACASSLQRREDAEHPWGHMAEKGDGGLCHSMCCWPMTVDQQQCVSTLLPLPQCLQWQRWLLM